MEKPKYDLFVSRLDLSMIQWHIVQDLPLKMMTEVKKKNNAVVGFSKELI